MHPARARLTPVGSVALLVVALGGSCTPSEGMWRDQYVFIGDEGTVLHLELRRFARGTAEAKGLVGNGDDWGEPFYLRMGIARRDAPSEAATVRALTARRDTLVRVFMDRAEGSLTLRLRTRRQRYTLTAEERPAGTTTDPEGTRSYRAGRAELATGRVAREPGWLLSEHTAPDQPQREHVDYGDFVLLFAVTADGRPVFAKGSREQRAFDDGRIGRAAGFVRGFRARVEGQIVRVTGVGVELAGTIAARSAGDGRAPGGEVVLYEALLLGGDLRGVAFSIRPAPE